jgi:aspartyl aminopeptidase
LDRDLTVAGKVVHFEEKSQKYRTSLYHEGRPLVKIPNLAIHLQPANERGKLDLNPEQHLRPVFSTEVADKLLGVDKWEMEGDKFNML